MLPPASVIIPTLNEEIYLPRLLDSLRALDAPIDIIVVDGHSDDGTEGVVASYQNRFTGDSSLRIIRSDRRHIAYQRNLGAMHAKHDLLIFCDADIIVTHPDSYTRILSRFMARELLVAVPRLRPVESRFDFHIVHGLAFWVQRLSMAFGRFYMPGGFVVTRKSVFGRVGGFDTGMTLAEDVNFGLRASRLGACEICNIPVSVSARRLIKYGYGWIGKNAWVIPMLLLRGKVPQDFHYPFGEFRA